jgi:hypothetical protein
MITYIVLGVLAIGAAVVLITTVMSRIGDPDEEEVNGPEYL